MEKMLCDDCRSNKLYTLQNGYLKCSRCKKKFSPQKIEKKHRLIDAFVQDLTVLETSKRLGLSYVGVANHFQTFREKIARFLEENYRQKEKYVLQYDEYLYLESSKKKDKKAIFDAKNFLTFDYGDKIYNLLLPPLDRYKSQFLDDHVEEVYYREFSMFLLTRKISKLKKQQNNIAKFWLFFEDFILKYKGVGEENFFYYLKEAEFKFNYTQEAQQKILQNL